MALENMEEVARTDEDFLNNFDTKVLAVTHISIKMLGFHGLAGHFSTSLSLFVS